MQLLLAAALTDTARVRCRGGARFLCAAEKHGNVTGSVFKKVQEVYRRMNVNHQDYRWVCELDDRQLAALFNVLQAQAMRTGLTLVDSLLGSIAEEFEDRLRARPDALVPSALSFTPGS